MVRPLYFAWLEFTLWIGLALSWLCFTQGDLNLWQPLIMWLFLALCYFVTKWSGYSPEALPLVAVLVFIGWLFLARLDPNLAEQQFWGFLVAILVYLVTLYSDFVMWSAPKLLVAGSLGLLIMTLLFGHRAGGAQAWLTVAGLRFQPVEVSKVLLILYVARKFATEKLNLNTHLVLGAFIVLLALQRDLGPILLVFLVFCTLALCTNFSWYRLLAYGATLVAGFFSAYKYFTHFHNRVLAWLFPWDYADSWGYQILQGLFALDAGGLIGQGLGNSLARVIPANHTDYLFAIIGEEFGLIGTISLTLVYVALLFWALNLVSGLEDRTNQAIGLGLTLLLHGQVFLVMGGILRLVPFTGMTLPFVSYGSSSLVTQFFMLGLITSLGRATNEEATN